MFLLKSFRKLAEFKKAESAYTFLMAHPVLMWPERWPEINIFIASLPANRRPPFERILAGVQRMTQALQSDPRGYPLGQGPIDGLLGRIQQGEITEKYALAQTSKPSIYKNLAPLYVDLLSHYAEWKAQSGDWRLGVRLLRLVQTALQARPDDAHQLTMWGSAVLGWLDTVTRACNDVPDGRLFYDAREKGEELVKNAKGCGLKDLASDALHRLGVLHLDTYITGRSSVNFDQQMKAWQMRLADVYGRDLAGIDEKELRLPPAAKAFAKAITYLKRALNNLSGLRRGRTLKALAEAFVWQSIVTDSQKNNQRALEAAIEARNLLVTHGNDREKAEVEKLIGYLEPQESVSEMSASTLNVEELLDEPLGQIVGRLGSTRAIWTLTQSAEAVKGRDPETALKLLEKVRPILQEYGNESERAQFYRNLLIVIGKAYGVSLSEDLEQQGIVALADVLEARAEAEGWPPRRRSASLLALSALGPNHDQEEGAMTLLQRAVATDQSFSSEYVDAFLFVKAVLGVGLAVNALRGGDKPQAIEQYMKTLSTYLHLDMPIAATQMLRGAEDLLDPSDERTAQRFAVYLAGVTVSFINRVGEPAHELLQDAWRAVMKSALTQQRGNPEFLLLVRQGAKGSNFAAALENWSPYRWQEDIRATAILARIEELKKHRSKRRTLESKDDVALDEHTLLTAYLGSREQKGGGTAEEMIENLEQTFDRHVNRVTQGEGRRIESILTVDEARQALDHRTVLVDYFMTVMPDGGAALTAFILTREDMAMTIGKLQLPQATIVMSEAEKEVKLNWLALAVSALREAVTDEPGPASVGTEGQDLLGGGFRSYFGGGLAKHLKDYRRQGKDHLVIIPHGPLHFYPFHLLGKLDKPLAEDWIVTYLPNWGLLRRRLQTPGAEPEKSGAAVFGLTFESSQPHSLPPLPEVEAEVKAVAKQLGVKELLGKDAHEAAFVSALSEASIIHLATHGRHRVSAPAFQSLFLYPKKGTDGILNAYEILGLDLHGMDLLSLSACETSLGRFDPSDNVCGLPGSFLLAGAKTILGTLWEVNSAAARVFFEAFYSQLTEGCEKRDAFASAQLKTRQCFPQYRDWGAFYLSGDW